MTPKEGDSVKKVVVLATLLALQAFAASGKDLAAKLGLDASSKASKQWERLFGDDGKKASMGIDKLSGGDQAELKKFLISHAADSDQPAVAGK